MAEPVYGLTGGAAKLLGEIGNKHRQVLPDEGRRARRVWPTRSAYLALMQYTDTDKYLGPMDQIGVKIVGECNVIGTPGSANLLTALDVSGAYIRAVIAPNDFFWGIHAGDMCYAVSGGVTFLDGLVTADSTLDTDEGIEVAYSELCGSQGDNYAEGQKIGVIFRWTVADGGSLVPITSCCPPGSSTT